MAKTVKLRDSGIVIPQQEFGQIFGGGINKGKALARDEVQYVSFGNAQIPFTLNDKSVLQGVVDMVYREHQTMQSMLRLTDDQVAALKPRIRVKAGRADHLSLVEPSLAGRIERLSTPEKKRPRVRYDPGLDEVFVASVPRKWVNGKNIYDLSDMAPEDRRKFRRAYQRVANRKFRSHFGRKSA